jgi:hypothetical protein
MYQFDIELQDAGYSRGELLLRSFFGWFYIVLPHVFLLFFFSIAGVFLQFLSFWVMLFTGKYPDSWFDFQVKLMRWNIRLNAVLMNMRDGYPAFGLDGDNTGVTFEVENPEHVDRVSVLIRALFGAIYVGIPHMFILFFRAIAMQVLSFLAFWAILFTGSYPASWFQFNVETLRWANRVNCYLMYITHEYPPFSGKA